MRMFRGRCEGPLVVMCSLRRENMCMVEKEDPSPPTGITTSRFTNSLALFPFVLNSPYAHFPLQPLIVPLRSEAFTKYLSWQRIWKPALPPFYKKCGEPSRILLGGALPPQFCVWRSRTGLAFRPADGFPSGWPEDEISDWSKVELPHFFYNLLLYFFFILADFYNTQSCSGIACYGVVKHGVVVIVIH